MLTHTVAILVLEHKALGRLLLPPRCLLLTLIFIFVFLHHLCSPGLAVGLANLDAFPFHVTFPQSSAHRVRGSHVDMKGGKRACAWTGRVRGRPLRIHTCVPVGPLVDGKLPTALEGVGPARGRRAAAPTAAKETPSFGWWTLSRVGAPAPWTWEAPLCVPLQSHTAA